MVLQICIQSVRERLVCSRVADKARIELNRMIQKRWQVLDEGVGQTAAPQKVIGSWADRISVR